MATKVTTKRKPKPTSGIRGKLKKTGVKPKGYMAEDGTMVPPGYYRKVGGKLKKKGK